MNTRELFDRIIGQVQGLSFSVEYWDGQRRKVGPGPDECVLCIRDEAACRDMLANLSLGFGENYMAGRIEVHGDLQKMIGAAGSLSGEIRLGILEKLKAEALVWMHGNTIAQSRRNAAHHYDLGNEFFRLWLGRDMAYSCAYFQSPTEDIDTAQRNKLAHLCRKLHLAPGQRLLDIGCGWGGLVLHAAHYGVQAVGITLSREQQREAQQRAADRRLDDRVTIALQDYRELPPDPRFDRIVSVGMFEHVGKEHYGEYLAQTARLLVEGGIGVLHSIGRMADVPTDPWIRKYIFPGGHFPALDEIIHHLGRSGLRVLDIESLRPHYVLTLERWIEAFEVAVPRVQAMYDETFVRMWRLYLAGSAAAFRNGWLDVYQIQFSKGLNHDLPLTRDYLYR